ncbi:MAG: hypothetical protein KDD67_12870 [Ignavibacteriae bacterium]|nr:hypothetical protein [Ignavibacteriota bacterium]MCB9214368.1 hypothetical protein [Ignavibacteria bacterium]
MTKVDNYLEKYLDGSISDRELQQFRDLLDAEPRLHSELSKTLELRSIIHDDLLALRPPEHLSEFVRENLAEQFAALATEEEERRPPLFFTGRLAGSSLVAMVALVLIALAPTWIAPSGGDRLAAFVDGGIPEQSLADAASQQVDVSSPQIPVNPTLAGSELTGSEKANISGAQPRSRTASVATLPSLQNDVVANSNDPSILSEEGSEAQSVDPLDAEIAAPAVALGNILDDEGNSSDELIVESALASNFQSRQLGLMGQDPNQAFREMRTNSNLFEKADIVDHAAESFNQLANGDIEASRSRSDRSLPSLDGNENRRRIMFGGTLASGLTTRESTFSVQGSAYMAMTLGEGSRIGLEGGSAMFSYRKVVAVQTRTVPTEVFGRRTVDRGELQGSEASLSGETFRAGGIGGPAGDESNSGRATDVPNETDPTNRGDGFGSRDWKSTQLLGGGSSIVQPVGGKGDVHYDYRSYEAETSMIYGLVFYDHTVTSLNKKLNINGRIGVGGADGGIVLNARAYAAISTHENVAWTLGVGGSMLHDFANDVDFNANYGVNAGVELGF